MASSSVVLEDPYDENYEPTKEEILEYAQCLGMDPVADEPLLWIARESLKAPLPADWKPCETETGEIYYFNFSTGESLWDHPLDEHYRNMYQEEKAKLAKNGGSAMKNANKNATLQPQDSILVAKERRKETSPKPTAGRRSSSPAVIKNGTNGSSNNTRSPSPSSNRSRAPEAPVSPVPRDRSPGRARPTSKSPLPQENAKKSIPESGASAKTSPNMNRLLEEKLAQLKQEKLKAQQQQQQQNPQKQQPNSAMGEIVPETTQYAETAQHLDQTYAETLATMESQLKQDYEARIRRRREQLQADELEEQDRLRREQQQRLEQLKRSLEAETRQHVDEIRQKSIAEIQQREQEKAHAELETLRTEMAAKRSVLLQELAQVEAEELAQFENHMEQKREQWKRELHQQELKVAQQRQDLEETSRRVQQQLEQVQSQLDAAHLADMEARRKDARTKWESTLAEEEERFQQEYEQLNQSWTTRLDDAEKSYKDTLREIQQRFEREQKQMQIELEDLRERQQRELERARVENSSVQEKLYDQTDELLEKQQKRRQMLEKDKQELDQLEAELKQRRVLIKEASLRAAPVKETPIRVEDLEVPPAKQEQQSGASFAKSQSNLDENSLLTMAVQDRLRNEEERIAQTRAALEAQRQQILEGYQANSTKQAAVASTNANKSLDKLTQSTFARLESDMQPPQNVVNAELEQDLHGVLQQLRHDRNSFGLTGVSPSMGTFRNSISAATPSSIYRPASYSTSLRSSVVTGTTPRSSSVWKSLETQQRQQALLREHSNWLREFRTQIGLDRRFL